MYEIKTYSKRFCVNEIYDLKSIKSKNNEKKEKRFFLFVFTH